MALNKVDLLKIWIQKWWVLWIVFFVFTAAMALFIQLIILPYFLPHVHYGHGLFVPDSTGFHQIAQNVAGKMANNGWEAWELKPEGLYPAGIASLFYYLWTPEPYSVIPFNAAVHATAGCLVFFLLTFFIKNRFVAVAGATLFIINPASFEWTAQIHRDGTFILGNLLVLSAWLALIKASKSREWQSFIYAPVLTLLGVFLILVSRPYWNQVALVACCCIFTLMLFVWVRALFRNISSGVQYIRVIILGCIIIAIQIPFIDKYHSFGQKIKSEQLQQEHSFNKSLLSEELSPYHLSIDEWRPGSVWHDQQLRDSGRSEKSFKQEDKWIYNRYIPDFIQSKMYGLSICRKGTASSGGKTSIDQSFKLNSVSAYISYLPRALQIGFLSPFPSLWIGTGSTPASTIGRLVMGFVTLFFYVLLIFFIWGLWVNRKSIELWIIFLYSTFGLLIFTYAYANVGTLMRLRYGFYMVIVGAGFAFTIQKILEYKESSSNK